MATKNIDGKNKNGKWVRISKIAALKAIESAKIVDDVLTVQGVQLIASAISLDPNGSDALETTNASVTPNALVLASIPPSVLAPAFALVAGASLDIDIIESNTGAVTITVDALPVQLLKKDGVLLAAGELEAGQKIRVTCDGLGAFQLVTDATKAADKALTAAAVAVQVAAAAASAAAAGISAGAAVGAAVATAADVVLTGADRVLTAADVIAAAASAAGAAAAVTAEIYRAPGTAVGDAVPVAIDFTTGGNRRVIELTTNAAGGAFTLADGNIIGALDGREITFILAVHAVNDAIITPANLANGNTVTLNTVGQSATLIYSETMGTWVVKATSGGVVVA